MKTYLVGGAVRDFILNRPTNDRDYVVVGSTAEEMLINGFLSVGKEFPVFLHPETKEEYALARTERKTGDKHTDFEFDFTPDITLETDILRRDFTCNGLAFNLETKEIIDYVGGVKDIENRVLKAIRPETFVQDALRVLRGARQSAQLTFEIAPETMELFKQMVADGMLEHLTPERVWKETEKALESPHFYKYILVLRECGALKVIMPEVDKLFETPEKIEYHPLGNTGLHIIECLKYLAGISSAVKISPIIMFATLLHDVGKGNTPEDILPAHHDHEHRGLELIDALCDRLRVPNEYRKFALMCCQYHMRLIKINDMAIKKQYDFVYNISDKFRNHNLLSDFLKVCQSDYFGEFRDRADYDDFFSTSAKVNLIYHIMNGITLKDLSNETQEILARHTGEKFGMLYREEMIKYLRRILENENS